MQTANNYRKAVGKCPVQFPGVNGIAICDCGDRSFMVGFECDIIGNNIIRCIQCAACGHQLAVPFSERGLE